LPQTWPNRAEDSAWADTHAGEPRQRSCRSRSGDAPKYAARLNINTADAQKQPQ